MEIVTEGLRFPEGPIAMPDGSVILVEIAAQQLTRVLPDGSKQVIAKTGGGPNGAALGPDGKIYVCNNARPTMQSAVTTSSGYSMPRRTAVIWKK